MTGETAEVGVGGAGTLGRGEARVCVRELAAELAAGTDWTLEADWVD